jgi:hypothetical protein
VGDSALDKYTPMMMNFNGISNTGNITVSTLPTNHPNISTSTLNNSATIQRHWKVMNSGLLFTDYNSTQQYLNSDISGSVNPAMLSGGLYTSFWSYPTVSGAGTNSISFTGMTSIGDMQLAMNNPCTPTSSTFTTTSCDSYTLPWGAIVTSSGTYTNLYTNASGCDSVCTIELTINPSASSTFTATACVSYTLPWGTIVTSSGTYTTGYTATNGCDSIITYQVTIGNIPLNLNNFITVSPTCNGSADGLLTFINMGGTGPYTFTFSNVVTNNVVGTTLFNLASSIYVIKATDANGCTAAQKIIVMPQPAKLKFGSALVNGAICNGQANGSITSITSNGGVGQRVYTISPNTGIINGNNITNLSAGTYTVTVQDANSCSATKTYSISQPSLIIINTVLLHPTNQALGSIAASATGGVGTKVFNINPSAGSTIGSTYTGLSAGTYTLTATDSKGCTKTSAVTLVQAQLLEAGLDIKAYPIPVIDQLNLNVIAKKDLYLSLTLFTIEGRIVQHIEEKLRPGDSTIQFDMKSVASGVYLLECISDGERKLIRVQKD